MKKWVMAIAMAAISCCAFAEGFFTVTQYNMTRRPNSISDAESVINNPSSWDGNPVTKHYDRISFADNPGVIPPYATVSFPGNGVSKHDCFVIEAIGSIRLSAGHWTFACGGDDGYEVSISGHNFTKTFSSNTPLGYDVTVCEMNIPTSGVYNVTILYFEYATCATLHFSAAKGSYSSFNSSAFQLVEAVEREVVVSFNANDGSGVMESQTLDATESHRLPANQFTRDGYVFLGWALAPDGEVVYQDGDEITVDSDMTLYAVWANPTLTLTAESANWSSGSITLRCEDADTSGSAHQYSLFYRDSNTWAMMPVEGATNVVAGADGFAHLTDTGFVSRQGGVGEVYYCVKDGNGRVSGVCTARKRHALCVGVGHYKKGYQEEHRLADLPNASVYAEAFASVARRMGGFASPRILKEASVTRLALDNELDGLASKSQPGDICLFYISTHGYMSGTEGGACLYDGDYTDDRLVKKVEQFCEKDAALVAVFSACQSEGLLQRSFANVGVIAAARAESFSDDFFDDFLIDYGWEKGWAGNGGTVSFGELAEYAKARYDALYRDVTLVDESDGECFPMTKQAHIDNLGLLERITAGSRGSHSAQGAPSAVSGIAASEGAYGNRIEVSWSAADNADGYLVFYGRGGTGTFMNSAPVEPSINPSCNFKVTDYPWMAASSAPSPVRFEVRAWNGAGVSVSSETEGWIDVESAATVPLDWLQTHHDIYEASEGNSAVAAAMTAANGCRTVGECFALGIDPEDPNDDFKIERFEMTDGKPVITLNHTEDGSGSSFATRIRTLGAKSLGASTQWDDVTDIADPDVEGYRFFKVKVELP